MISHAQSPAETFHAAGGWRSGAHGDGWRWALRQVRTGRGVPRRTEVFPNSPGQPRAILRQKVLAVGCIFRPSTGNFPSLPGTR
ncbi:hypothetical protein LEMLEM_LOCUS11595 [Lemmus lemmus]